MALTETLSQVNDALYDFIIPGLESVILNQSIVLDKLKKTSKDVSGRTIKFKYRLGGNAKAGWATERGTLPTAGARQFDEATATLRYFYMPVDISGQELAMPKSGGVIDLAADALEDTVLMGVHKMDNALLGDGSGRICQLTDLATYSGATEVTTCLFDNGKGEQLLVGQNVRFDTDGTDYEVASVDAYNSTFTVSGDATTDATDEAWVYNGADYVSGFAKVLTGLEMHAAISNNGVHSAYQSFDRTAAGTDFTKPYVNSNSGTDRALTSLLIRRHLQRIKARGKMFPNFHLTNEDVLNSYILLLESQAQKIDPMPDETGYKEKYKFVYAGKKAVIEISNKVKAGWWYTLNTNTIEIREMKKMGWDTTGSGGPWEKKFSTDAVWGRVKWYLNMICRNNTQQGVIQDILENSIVA